jgi:diguanylate cyclase (GGDEF)-like protein
MIISNDRPDNPWKLSELARNEGIRGFVCMPLVQHGRRLGVLYLYRNDRDAFFDEEIKMLATFSHLASGAIENATLYAKSQGLVATDALTGLYNRRVLDERLEGELQRSSRYGKSFSFMMLDLDKFKSINDTYGHLAGDAVLKQVGEILKENTREVDSPIRFGGEEFAIVLPELNGDAAKITGERIRMAVSAAAFSLPDGRKFNVTASMGIASYPECAKDADTLIKHADQALYLAKREGRNRVMLYRDLLLTELVKSPRKIAELLLHDLGNARMIATAINTRTAYLRDHSDRVEDVAMRFGEKLGLSKEELKVLSLSAILHDVGYASSPENVLNKRDPFTKEERRLIEQHPIFGYDLLADVPLLHEVREVIRQHHEWYDGSGYPDGKRGDGIHRLARILAIADTYVAMTSDRPQRRAMDFSDMRALLLSDSGKHFDPRLLEEFVGSFSMN